MSNPERADSPLRKQIELPDSIDRDKLRVIMIYRGLGFTQEEIAEQVDVSQRTISRYLSEIKSIVEETDSPAKAVFYSLFISMFADKFIDTMAWMVELSEGE